MTFLNILYERLIRLEQHYKINKMAPILPIYILVQGLQIDFFIINNLVPRKASAASSTVNDDFKGIFQS